MSPDIRIEDWYLFQEHTIRIIYGSEVKSYLLPTLLTSRMYALEFIIHKIDSGYIHFASRNHLITFKVPKKIGPFVIKSITTKFIEEYILKELNIEQGEEMKYDPHQVISKRRRQNKLYAYSHRLNLDLENATNLDTWKQVKWVLQGASQQLISEQATL